MTRKERLAKRDRDELARRELLRDGEYFWDVEGVRTAERTAVPKFKNKVQPYRRRGNHKAVIRRQNEAAKRNWQEAKQKGK